MLVGLMHAGIFIIVLSVFAVYNIFLVGDDTVTQ